MYSVILFGVMMLVDFFVPRMLHFDDFWDGIGFSIWLGVTLLISFVVIIIASLIVLFFKFRRTRGEYMKGLWLCAVYSIVAILSFVWWLS